MRGESATKDVKGSVGGSGRSCSDVNCEAVAGNAGASVRMVPSLISGVGSSMLLGGGRAGCSVGAKISACLDSDRS